MSEHSLLHLALPSPQLPPRSRSARWSVLVVAILYASTGLTLALFAVRAPTLAATPTATEPAAEKALEIPRIVFLQMPGPGGGGGGGGNRQPQPPSRAQGIGKDRLTLPVAKRIVVEPNPSDSVPAPLVALNAIPLASGTTYQIGMPEAPPSLAFSQGPGSGGGVGTGTGTGIGSGAGAGLGPGSGGGFGGGAYRPGNGVTAPTLVKQVTPRYTPDAMERKIQGTVVLEAVVDRDGIPAEIRVVRSLDAHGLDEEAIKAARQWRFTPGRLGDTPVDVLVRIMLDFRIH